MIHHQADMGNVLQHTLVFMTCLSQSAMTCFIYPDSDGAMQQQFMKAIGKPEDPGDVSDIVAPDG